MKRIPGYILLLFLVSSACTSTQFSSAVKTANDMLGQDEPLTSSEVIQGLKEALVKGAEYSTNSASKVDGYLKNPAITIPFPPEISEIQTKLRQVGLNKPVDDFITSINRAAEKAAKEAKPLLVSAITGMTIQDGWTILRGDDDAATAFLRKNTEAQLEVKFEPIISNALDQVNATRYYETMVSQYNKIPFVKKVDTDLTKYVTDKAMDGLFILVADEEKKIRESPLERTTDLLKKVFGYEE